ncbi:hypothetical protein [Bizionia sp.]|uniref:hypothetical protein n=1 Tax=Bizionia sp. TaxID=1954480 RepID=UPI003A958B9A
MSLKNNPIELIRVFPGHQEVPSMAGLPKPGFIAPVTDLEHKEHVDDFIRSLPSNIKGLNITMPLNYREKMEEFLKNGCYNGFPVKFCNVPDHYLFANKD